MDNNFIKVVSQISRILQFEITQKKFHQKHFTIIKPLLYLVLRVKKSTLPGKCAQTGQGSRKSDFWALLGKIRLFCCFEYWESFWIDDFSQKVSNSRFKGFSEVLASLTSRKFTHNLKKISLVQIWMIFQWFSSTKNFVGTAEYWSRRPPDFAPVASVGNDFSANDAAETLHLPCSGYAPSQRLLRPPIDNWIARRQF